MKDRGFSLVESLVALVLTLSVTGAVFALITPNAQVSQAQPEAIDMQQRARVATDLLARDLFMAGAGPSAGPQTGSLARFMAPVLPRRLGLTGADADIVARADAITIVYVPALPVQTTVGVPMPSGASVLDVDYLPNCPLGRLLCGLEEGMNALVFDDAGHFDLFAITTLGATAADVRHLGALPSQAYRDDASLVQAEVHTYYFDRLNQQLRHYDGYLSDVAVVDNVVDVVFEYFGEPDPPLAPKPAPGTANCLYDAAGNPISGLGRLPTAGASLASLPMSLMDDGPWCGAGGTRFDADLLRVRRIRVTLRIQASLPGLRGAGPDFRVSGISRSALRTLPDYTVTFDVTPRNMNLGR